MHFSCWDHGCSLPLPSSPKAQLGVTQRSVAMSDAGKCCFRKSSRAEETHFLQAVAFHGFPYEAFSRKDEDELLIFLFLGFIKGSLLL